MCTYDYTPYTGCEAGEQHYYIQWVKCTKATENRRYCSLQKSTEVEQLRKLSTNVLSCPLHGPVAVQQYILDAANQPTQEDDQERSRARSTTRRGDLTSRSRTPARTSSDRDFERPVRRESHRRKLPRAAPESSDSESPKPPADDGPRSAMMRRRQMARKNPHRRSLSADMVLLPPPTLTMQHGRSNASLPLRADSEDSSFTMTEPQTAGLKSSLEIPRIPGIIGLPSSPDMHRQAGVHRSRSEGLLRQTIASQLESSQPPSSNNISPDNSPDRDPELPFSSPGRRGRRTATRSVRDRSVDTVMRRIDEHVVSEETPPERRGSATNTPEPPHNFSHPRRELKPRLNNLQIPKPSDNFQRDAYSAPTATLPDSEITSDLPSVIAPNPPPSQPRHHLLRPALSPPPSILSHRTADDAASIRSGRSRRFEDQVVEGRKWAAARDHMPLSTVTASPRGPATDVLAYMSEPNLALGITNNTNNGAPPPVLAARESVDSGYRSGHQRNLLQKMPPPSQFQSQAQQQLPAQIERQKSPSPQGIERKHVPPPLDLRGLPPYQSDGKVPARVRESAGKTPACRGGRET
ncbi:hypothetical protein N0V88_006317 [Collariella sp. IMI 366227]|nr:hypothetical protein N0V88_006317 [Collariella sp. IMI 366227]